MPTKKTKKPARGKLREAVASVVGEDVAAAVLAKDGPRARRITASAVAATLRKAMDDEEAADTLAGGGYSRVREVFPTGLSVLDEWVIGIGGLPYGRIVEVSGNEDVGKSSLVNHLMGAAQRDGAIACLGESERKVTPDWVARFGVSQEDVVLLPARTIEQFCEEVKVLFTRYPRNKFAVFLDSVATTEAQKALDEDLEEKEIPAVMAAAWSRALRTMSKPLASSLVSLVLVNQMRSKVGVMYGPTEATAAGRAIPYYASLRLKLSHTSGGIEKEGALPVGKWIRIQAFKNHLAPAFREAKVLLSFTEGFQNDKSTLHHAREMQVVDKGCRSAAEAALALGWSVPGANGVAHGEATKQEG